MVDARSASLRIDTSARIQPCKIFYAVGVAFVVTGGLIAAVASPLQLEKGSWLAAYLVLVCGVAQAALGRWQESLSPRPVSTRLWATQFVAWNVGNALVVVGTLRQLPFVVDVGGLLLFGVVVLAASTLRGGRARPRLWAYSALLLVLAVTIPVGLVLAHVRS
ncbi:hypothetical protein [Streptomyces sp. TP-A0874]|uniref:hypothetical protein n=1 Tax=Streptomyces sp. TP-A0874 TaxID=549819 RepID=UPI000853C5C9|nr:hypothetical protein [Streptomyces sp. TP-A0874]